MRCSVSEIESFASRMDQVCKSLDDLEDLDPPAGDRHSAFRWLNNKPIRDCQKKCIVLLDELYKDSAGLPKILKPFWNGDLPSEAAKMRDAFKIIGDRLRVAAANNWQHPSPPRSGVSDDSVREYIEQEYGEQTGHLRRMVKRLRGMAFDETAVCGGDAGTDNPEEPQPGEIDLPPRAKTAWEQYQAGSEAHDKANTTDDQVYDLLVSTYEMNGKSYSLPIRPTWKRNLRLARQKLGQQKNKTRSGRGDTSRSIVHQSSL